MLLGSREVRGLEVTASFGFLLGFCADRWEVDAVLSGKVEGGLHAGLEPLHGSPQICYVAAPSTPVAEKPTFRIDVEARVRVFMVRAGAAADESAPGGSEVRIAAGELGEVHPLAQLLERAHARSLRCSRPLLGHRLLSGKESVAQIWALAPSLQGDRFGTEPAPPYRLSSCTI